MDRVPNKKIDIILGIAFGSCRVQGERAGKWSVKDGERTWPWAEDPEHYESLYRIAETSLMEKAQMLGAEAVVGIRAQSDRDHLGRPGILIVGTAVRFSADRDDISAPVAAQLPDVDNGPKETISQGIVSIAFEGKKNEWEPLEAIQKAFSGSDGERDSVMGLANILGIPQDRALALYRAGLRTVMDVASSNPGDLARICGMNPTQARILLESAKEALGEEVN